MKKFFYLFLISCIFFGYYCSTKYIHPGFIKFNEAMDLIGKNVIYSFEKLQEEEMNLRVAETVKKEMIKPSDLEPRVLNFEHLETRKEFINYLVNYSELLVSLFEEDTREEIIENAEIVYGDLKKISENHENFLTKNEIGIMSTISSAIPEVLTYAKKRTTILKIMNQNQPLLEKNIEALIKEMEATRIMINNFYDRQFRLSIVEKWPVKESGREKFAKNGVKILINKNKINIILTDVLNALQIIPEIHRDLKKSLKTHGSPVRSIKDIIDYAYRIKEMYKEFSE